MAEAFATLGLGEHTAVTQDAIRRAYLRQVRAHPPERDPEGFRRVREAYEIEPIGQERARLGAYIASFRGAMDRQDRVAIEAEREALRRVTAELDSQHRVPRP